MKIQQKYFFKTVTQIVAITLFLGTNLSADSLWLRVENSESSQFSDIQATQVGDIVTVINSEKVSVSATASNTSKRDTTIQNAVNKFLFPVTTSGLGSHNGSLPETDITTKQSVSADGTLSNGFELSDSKASVLVVDVLPNGNLVIEGRRVTSVAGETQYGIMRGIIRSYDIGRSAAGGVDRQLLNTIYSQYIANAQIEFIPEGNLTQNQKDGWLTRASRFLWPF
jgi:flagellar L-ring protein precursor FlgH|tara:strand:- start:1464 stop:2138 length:675 start_codon:yes stop_codon:yes gene_type:complete